MRAPRTAPPIPIKVASTVGSMPTLPVEGGATTVIVNDGDNATDAIVMKASGITALLTTFLQDSSEYSTLTIFSNDTEVEYSISDKPLEASLRHKVVMSHIDSVNLCPVSRIMGKCLREKAHQRRRILLAVSHLQAVTMLRNIK